MNVRLLALVEGQTEEQFCKSLIAPFLRHRRIYLSATTMGRSRTVAGVPSWKRAEKVLRQLLLEDQRRHVTTMFDYYGMPDDWPGRADAGNKPHTEKASTIEEGMRTKLQEVVGKHWRAERFIPYVQMHEFEALLFTGPKVLGTVSVGSTGGDAVRRFRKITDSYSTPEEIDDGKATAPSKRIEQVAPEYEKVSHGVIAAKKIGLPAIRSACPNFDAWMHKLEALANAGS